MGNYVATTEISHPINVGLKEDVNLNGLSFSYTHGIFYQPVDQDFPVKLPPPYQSGMGARGQKGGIR